MYLYLVHSPAEITRQLLYNEAVLTASGPPTPPILPGDGWAYYSSNEPTTPDQCITTYDTPNRYDGRNMVDGEIEAHYGIQIRVRSTNHFAGYLKAHGIETALTNSYTNRTIEMAPTQTAPAATYHINAFSHTHLRFIGMDGRLSRRYLIAVTAFLSVIRIA